MHPLDMTKAFRTKGLSIYKDWRISHAIYSLYVWKKSELSSMAMSNCKSQYLWIIMLSMRKICSKVKMSSCCQIIPQITINRARKIVLWLRRCDVNSAHYSRHMFHYNYLPITIASFCCLHTHKSLTFGQYGAICTVNLWAKRGHYFIVMDSIIIQQLTLRIDIFLFFIYG